MKAVPATIPDDPAPVRTIPEGPGFLPAPPSPAGALPVVPRPVLPPTPVAPIAVVPSIPSPRAQRGLALLLAPRPRSWVRRAVGFTLRFGLSLALGVLAWNAVGPLHDLVIPALDDLVMKDARPFVSPAVFGAMTFLSTALVSFLVFRLTSLRRRGILR